MRSVFKGIHRVPACLKDGTPTVYDYHRATRRRLCGERDSPEYFASYLVAEIDAAMPRSHSGDHLFKMVSCIPASKRFSCLPLRTRIGLLSVIEQLPPTGTARTIIALTAEAGGRAFPCATNRNVSFQNYPLKLLLEIAELCEVPRLEIVRSAISTATFHNRAITRERRLIACENARGDGFYPRSGHQPAIRRPSGGRR